MNRQTKRLAKLGRCTRQVKGQCAGSGEGERTRGACNYNEEVVLNAPRKKKPRDFDGRLRALSDKRVLDKRITGGRFRKVRNYAVK